MRERNSVEEFLQNPDKFKCARCSEIRPVEDFYAPRPGKILPKQPCKPCWVIKNREQYQKSGHRTGYDRVYEQVLRDKYGLTLEDYEAMERAQGKRCAICQRPETKKRRNGERYRLSVDHDHATNAVRALVCHRCNLVVWALEDNHTTLAAVTAYITAHRIKFAEP